MWTWLDRQNNSLVTHHKNVIDKAFLEILLPVAGSLKVVVHLDDAHAGDPLCEGPGGVAVAIVVQPLGHLALLLLCFLHSRV